MNLNDSLRKKIMDPPGEHPRLEQIAEIVIPTSSGRYNYGTGYRISPSLVLTVRHLFEGIDHRSVITVRFSGAQDIDTVKATIVWIAEAPWIDIALLHLHWPDVPPPTSLVTFGHLHAARARRVPFLATGFPAFRQISRKSGNILRDSYQISGDIATQTNAKTGALELTRGGRVLATGPKWKGTSGAAVFVHNLLVGIISEADSDGALQAVPIVHATHSSAKTFPEGQELQSNLDWFRDLIAEEGLPTWTVPARRPTGEAERVRQIARRTSSLEGRKTELARLTEFSQSSSTYQWWIGAPWAGKTALAAFFASHPPSGIDVVAFFISRSEGAQTRQFQQAVCDQLASILDEPCPQWADQGALIALWNRAVEQAESTGRHLLLLVDGLDENDELPPIAALLPSDVGPYAHVLVLSRHEPPIPDQVVPEHPLRDQERCPRIMLSSSPHARLLRQRAVADLSSQLRIDIQARHMFGLLAAAGPLSADEAATVLDIHRIGKADIDRITHSAAGRALRISQPNVRKRYAFAHDVLRAVTIDELGTSAINNYRSLVHEWADSLADSQWPIETPDYLLEIYPTVLSTSREIRRLTALPTPERLKLWRNRQGHDAGAVRELEMALDALVDDDSPDVGIACALALRLQALRDLVSNLPPEIAEGWAALGHWDRAYHIAYSLRSDLDRQSSWAKLAIVAIQANEFERATDVAEQIKDPSSRAKVLARLASAVAYDGQIERAQSLLDRAEEAAADITDRDIRDRVLTVIASASADANDDERVNRLSRDIQLTFSSSEVQASYAASLAKRGDLLEAYYIAAEIADVVPSAAAVANTAVIAHQIGDYKFADRAFGDAVELARSVSDWAESQDALSAIAAALARSGRVEEMRAILETVDSPRAGDLAHIAIALSSAGKYDISLGIINRVTSPNVLARAKSEIAARMMQSGNVERASELFDEAKAATDRIRETYDRINILAEIAVVAADFGDSEHSVSFLDDAERAAKASRQPNRAGFLASVALASARAGDVGRAQALLNTLELSEQLDSSKDYPDGLLNDIATAAAEAGRWSEAEHVMACITDSKERQWALVNLAAVAARYNDSDRTDELASRLSSPQMRMWVIAKIAVEIAGTGRFTEALRRVGQLEVRDVKSWTLTRIAVTAGGLGDLTMVQEVVGYLHDPGQTILAMVEAAKSARDCGKHRCALALLPDIASHVDFLPEFDRRAWVYAEIASIAASLGSPRNAQVWLTRGKEIGRQIADPAVRNRILSRAILAEACTFGIGSAGELIKVIRGQESGAWLWSDLVVGLAHTVEVEYALDICHVIEDPLARAAALAAIAAAVAARGDLSLAGQLVDEAESYIITGMDVARTNLAAARIFDAATMVSEKRARRSLIKGLRSGVIGPWLARGILTDPSSLDRIMEIVLAN